MLKHNPSPRPRHRPRLLTSPTGLCMLCPPPAHRTDKPRSQHRPATRSLPQPPTPSRATPLLHSVTKHVAIPRTSLDHLLTRKQPQITRILGRQKIFAEHPTGHETVIRHARPATLAAMKSAHAFHAARPDLLVLTERFIQQRARPTCALARLVLRQHRCAVVAKLVRAAHGMPSPRSHGVHTAPTRYMPTGQRAPRGILIILQKPRGHGTHVWVSASTTCVWAQAMHTSSTNTRLGAQSWCWRRNGLGRGGATDARDTASRAESRGWAQNLPGTSRQRFAVEAFAYCGWAAQRIGPARRVIVGRVRCGRRGWLARPAGPRKRRRARQGRRLRLEQTALYRFGTACTARQRGRGSSRARTPRRTLGPNCSCTARAVRVDRARGTVDNSGAGCRDLHRQRRRRFWAWTAPRGCSFVRRKRRCARPASRRRG